MERVRRLKIPTQAPTPFVLLKYGGKRQLSLSSYALLLGISQDQPASMSISVLVSLRATEFVLCKQSLARR